MVAVVAGSLAVPSSASAAPATTTIVAEHSSKCLDVRGGPTAVADGALIEQWSCTGQANQAWTLNDRGSGRYELVASSSGKCVDVVDGATHNGARIQQAGCTGAPRQLWTLKSKGNGSYEIISVSSGRCLDVTGGPTATADGVLTELWDCTGQANQSWALTAPSVGSTPQPLVAKHSRKCMDVTGGPGQTANGAIIEQWSCTGESNQNWTLRDMSGGQYEIIAQSSGKCIESVNGGTANLTKIQQWDCTGQPHQLWRMESAGAAGEYRFVHVPSGRCLDVTGGVNATGDGVHLELWDCTGQANQTWSIGAPATPPGSGPHGQDPSNFRSTFSEEFNGGFDTSVWNDHIWYEGSNPTKNYKVSNGALKIWPERDASGQFFNRTVDTDGKYYQRYGFFEMEAKLPLGKGVWPAFWLFNHIDDRRPEIDVMEAYPGAGPNSGPPWGDSNLHPTGFAATVWPNGSSASGPAGHRAISTPDLSADFHKYAVKWEPNKLTFYFDGQEFYSLNVTMSDPMYIMLDLWFGSASGTPDASTPTGEGNAFEVNYVRAWQFQ
ncbi:RICIN domain-containing protein [Streptomyces sp. V4I23]|uniref:RICIN domain-containing protein n=1 Tax=Streptomyces sp. V4I23 TaxID=3042282 RepID=UPI0027D7E0C0|nr:RICIN domain-containing protein [Streptomyces sp. V4I23]